MANSTIRTLTANNINGISSNINFITNGSAEVNTSPWATYADASQPFPENGTGGSPAITWTRSTSSPLVGTASFLFTKDAANRRGQGASCDFTIDSAYQAKVLQIQFEYSVASGTFVAGTSSSDSDVTVWIYDITNNQLIQPSTFRLFASSSTSTTFVSNFQTAANSTNYRLIFHVRTSTPEAFTLKFDDIRVTPSQYVYGTPITDWTAPGVWTPTGTWTTNTTYSGQWRRVGDTLEARLRVLTSGAPTATQLQINLPNSLTIDTNKVPTSGILAGRGYAEDAATTGYDITVLGSGGNSFVVPVALGSASAYVVTASLTNTVPFSFGANDFVIMSFAVPITGWSSSVQTSDQTSNRLIAGSFVRSTNQSLPNATETTVVWNSANYDKTASMNLSTGVWTAPESGVYTWTTHLAFNTNPTGIRYHKIYKNGTTDVYAPALDVRTTNGDFVTSQSSGEVELNAGETIQVRAFQNAGGALDLIAARSYFTISKKQSPNTISATELVTVQAASSAGTVLSNGNTVVFGTENWDSHNTYDASTGIFTAPVSGTYEVGVFLRSGNFIPSAGNFYAVNVCKNGTTATYQVGGVSANAAVTQTILIGGVTQVKLNAGETIRITVAISSGTYTLLNDATTNVLNIKRIGL